MTTNAALNPANVVTVVTPPNTIFIMKTLLIAVLAAISIALPAVAQEGQRHFDWTPANNETVRLDPAYYHAGRTYHPGSDGGNLHVEIRAQQPVTIFMVAADEWNYAAQNPEVMPQLHAICMNEHVSHTIYECKIPGEPMTLIIRDERASLEPAVFAGLGAVLEPGSPADRAIGTGIAAIIGKAQSNHSFKSPNDVHVQYFSWTCVANCVQPEFQWVDQAKEKYKLSSFAKIYTGFTPQFDGEQVSVKINSPIPLAVAILPSDVANQVYSSPQALQSDLQKSSCQQRGVQTSQFQCTFNAADGPQSLVVVPEQTGRVPNKKVEIEWLTNQCVENCEVLSQPPQSAQQQ